MKFKRATGKINFKCREIYAAKHHMFEKNGLEYFLINCSASSSNIDFWLSTNVSCLLVWTVTLKYIRLYRRLFSNVRSNKYDHFLDIADVSAQIIFHEFDLSIYQPVGRVDAFLDRFEPIAVLFFQTREFRFHVKSHSIHSAKKTLFYDTKSNKHDTSYFTNLWFNSLFSALVFSSSLHRLYSSRHSSTALCKESILSKILFSNCPWKNKAGFNALPDTIYAWSTRYYLRVIELNNCSPAGPD